MKFKTTKCIKKKKYPLFLIFSKRIDRKMKRFQPRDMKKRNRPFSMFTTTKNKRAFMKKTIFQEVFMNFLYLA